MLLFLRSDYALLPNIRNYDLDTIINYPLSRYLFGYVNVLCIAAVFLVVKLVIDFFSPTKRSLDTKFDTYFLGAICLSLFSLFHNFNADYTQMIIPVFSSLFYLMLLLLILRKFKICFI